MRPLFTLLIAALALPIAAQDLYLLDTRSGETRQITDTPDVLEFNPSFSNNGRQVVHDLLNFSPSFTHDLWITDLDSGVSTPLAGGEGGNDADWSPNGDQIAFDRVPDGDFTVYTIDASGGTPTAVAADGYDPSWSGNSRRIAFQSILDGSLRTVAADGTGETIVDGAGSHAAWSPNNQYIAFARFYPPNFDTSNIFCVRVGPNGEARSAPVQLTTGAVNDQRPAWADSKTVVFHSNRDGDFDIYSVDCRRPGAPVRIGGNPGTGDFDPGAQRHFVAYSGSALPPPPFAGGSQARLSASGSEVGPNPFRTRTSVRVVVREAAPVRVEIYDTMGRHLTTLVDRTLPAGEHRVTWSAGTAPTGVYVARVRVGDEVSAHALTRVR